MKSRALTANGPRITRGFSHRTLLGDIFQRFTWKKRKDNYFNLQHWTSAKYFNQPSLIGSKMKKTTDARPAAHYRHVTKGWNMYVDNIMLIYILSSWYVGCFQGVFQFAHLSNSERRNETRINAQPRLNLNNYLKL